MSQRFFFSFCIAVMAVTLIASGGYSATHKYEETGQQIVTLEGEEILFVGNKRGDIVLIGEEGRSDIEILFTKKVRAESEAEAKELAGSMKVVFKRKEGELIIAVEYPETDRASKSLLSILLQRDPRFSMDLEMRVPSHMIINAKASSGDIIVSDVGKSVVLSAASGDVVAERIGGDIEIGVSSGDVEIEGAGGDVKIVSASGDISATDVTGDMEVRTSSGNTELERIGGDLVIASSSGDISVTGVGAVTYKGASGDAGFYEVRGCVQAGAASGDMEFYLEPDGNRDYNVRTSSGEIELRFFKRAPGGYVLKANTTSGDISVDLPIEITKVGRHYIAGVVREGKSVVLLETVTGDIGISEDEE